MMAARTSGRTFDSLDRRICEDAARFEREEEFVVVSWYEAGPDGLWLHLENLR